MKIIDKIIQFNEKVKEEISSIEDMITEETTTMKLLHLVGKKADLIDKKDKTVVSKSKVVHDKENGVFKVGDKYEFGIADVNRIDGDKIYLETEDEVNEDDDKTMFGTTMPEMDKKSEISFTLPSSMHNQLIQKIMGIIGFKEGDEFQISNRDENQISMVMKLNDAEIVKNLMGAQFSVKVDGDARGKIYMTDPKSTFDISAYADAENYEPVSDSLVVGKTKSIVEAIGNMDKKIIDWIDKNNVVVVDKKFTDKAKKSGKLTYDEYVELAKWLKSQNVVVVDKKFTDKVIQAIDGSAYESIIKKK